MPLEAAVTRWRKIAGGIASALLVCLLLAWSLRPQSAPANAWRSLLSRSNATPPSAAGNSSKPSPEIFFWAWERSEDLRFLSPQRAGVAFLAKTIYLSQPAGSSANSKPSFSVRPRLQPLRVAPGSLLVAVVRIETQPPASLAAVSVRAPSSSPISYSLDFRDSLASEISALQSLPGVVAIQIDFDAAISQRSFYAALLQDVRRKLPASLPLSITALASWCIGDPWLAQLPAGTVDEAVPMLFRMGPSSSDVLKFLRSGRDFPVRACRSSLGLSTDEPLSAAILSGEFAGLAAPARSKRVYVFAPRAWTPPSAQRVLSQLQP